MLFTIGHSTRTIEELLELLRQHDIALLVDVRRFPASRRHPHFSREPLERALRAQGLDYQWVPELGGRRTARPGSRNTAWRVPAFAGYADHMLSDEFTRSATALLS